MSPRHIAPLIGRAATIVIAALALALVVVTLVIPRVTGGASLTVLSGSMTPTYSVGSVVVVLPVEPAEVEEGDVITFYKTPTSKSLTTHRVIETHRTVVGNGEAALSFTTRGDANESNDREPIPAEAVRGRVWFHVPFIGHLRDAVATPLGLGTIVGLAGIALLWERASSVVRRRLGVPPQLSAEAAVPGPTNSAGAPSVAEAPPAVVTATADAADVATEETGDAGGLDAVQLPGVTVDSHATTRVEQQLLVARLSVGGLARGKVIELLDLVRGHVVSIGSFHMVVSVTGTPEHIDGVEQLLLPYGLIEASRSAVVHVGGESAPENHVDQAPAGPTTGRMADLHTLVLRPPVPPDLVLAGPPTNGHRPQEVSSQ